MIRQYYLCPIESNLMDKQPSSDKWQRILKTRVHVIKFSKTENYSAIYVATLQLLKVLIKHQII